MEKANSITFKVYGRLALFSDPLTRMGGEKYSYPVPTYQALKGIAESIYWKPTFVWQIDRVKVLNPIRTETRGVKPLDYQKQGGVGHTLSIYTYLVDVAYVVQAHFVWNLNRPDLAGDRNENKHFYIAKRMLEKGGRRDVFLGTRECQGYVLPCEFDHEQGAYDHVPELSFGLMVHGLNYPDETGRDQLEVRLWMPQMRGGVIDFIAPEACPVVRPVKRQEAKAFTPGRNFTYSAELYQEEGGQP